MQQNKNKILKNKRFYFIYIFYVGYYADQLSVAQEVRGNHTVRVKNESRGFHLNNLSYAGPIVMGVGGKFIILLLLNHNLFLYIR